VLVSQARSCSPLRNENTSHRKKKVLFRASGTSPRASAPTSAQAESKLAIALLGVE